ncbi:F-box domain, Leucine-rich repeat domain, L domain-like protein [Artemisia annua]|uniref:F-box domain, Leucine-rich repeat domain, L domain-like protein n=2 Tax=Artemisia annua TaxID=35608 RepID=A0A2U1QPF2_ARTAN|nr:F-box domain, Leucine-rich repeat domain, L domain-like protein [Artemisia annua]
MNQSSCSNSKQSVPFHLNRTKRKNHFANASEIRDVKENMNDTTDWISQLPEYIVHHILSFLDSPLDLLRMSVLSKNWFALTASSPKLDFDIVKFTKALQISGKPVHRDKYVSDNFFKYVDYTTSRFSKQNVSVHRFNLATILREHTQFAIIDRCLGVILKKGVHEFEIRNILSAYPLPMYRLPNIVLSVSSLTSLKIGNCELPSSLMVDDVRFKSLERLFLEKVPINEEMIKCLTTSCPLLKYFTVKDCYGFKRFSVYGHQYLQKVWIYYNHTVERIDIEAPNLCHLLLMDWEGEGTPSINLASCKKLKTLSYYEFPSPKSTGLANFSSNFPFIENLFLKLPRNCNNVKLSSPTLRRIVLHSQRDLEKFDLNAPNLHLFVYKDHPHMPPPLVTDSAQSKAQIECHITDDIDILWFHKLRRFLDKKNGFQVLKFHITANFMSVEDLKVIQLPAYELEHVELEVETIDRIPVYLDVVDALLCCCRPRSVTLRSKLPFIIFNKQSRVVKFTYGKLLQQEDQGQTNIQIVVSSCSSKTKRHFSNLNSYLTALPFDRKGQEITFIKE